MTTALRSIQDKANASFGRFFDIELPARFTGLESEWNAARKGCAVIDAGFRSLLRATGSERAQFLQGMLTNEIVKQKPGNGVHAAHLTIQGRVISDMRVFILGEEIWLDVPVQRRVLLKATLERYIVADDVELVDDDAVMPLLALEGPRSAEVAEALLGAGAAALGPLSHAEHPFEGVKLRRAAVTHTGEAGFLLFGPSAAAETLWARARDAGAVPAGMEALDVLRVEAGIPWCDRDMDETTLAPEVGLESAISFGKGCYLGQEVVERVAARGQVQRRLVGLVCDGERIPSAGAKVHRDGEEVGAVTSALWSLAKSCVIALAYVRRSSWDEGTTVEVDGSGGARIATLPFYKTPST
jgi:folate-binding protein YgfZ